MNSITLWLYHSILVEKLKHHMLYSWVPELGLYIWCNYIINVIPFMLYWNYCTARTLNGEQFIAVEFFSNLPQKLSLLTTCQSRSSLTSLTICLPTGSSEHKTYYYNYHNRSCLSLCLFTYLSVCWVIWGQSWQAVEHAVFCFWRQDWRLQVDVCLRSGHFRTRPGLLS